MASILATTFPDKVPHFTAHLRTVIKAARNFEGTAWATYDAVCRRQVAYQGSLEWGVIDKTPSIARLLPAGRAISHAAFTARQTLMHHTSVCAQATPQAIPPTALDGRRHPSQAMYHPNPASQSMPVPEMSFYNSTGCWHFRCKYAHLCARCCMPHPVPDCETFHGGNGPP